MQGFWICLLLGASLLASIRPASASLILTILTDKGLLIAADRKNEIPNTDTVITRRKIYEIDTFRVIGSTGTPIFFEKHISDGKVAISFDASSVVSRAIKACDREKPLLVQLAEITPLLETAFLETRPRDNSVIPNPVCVTRIFSYHPETQKFEIGTVTLYWLKDKSISCAFRLERETLSQYSILVPMGRAEVFEELVRGKDSRFDEMRQDSHVKRILKSTTVPTLDEGRELLRWFFKECAQKTKLLVPGDDSIGADIDCCIIDGTGMQWLPNIDAQ